jgi:hypothetical protein
MTEFFDFCCKAEIVEHAFTFWPAQIQVAQPRTSCCLVPAGSESPRHNLFPIVLGSLVEVTLDPIFHCSISL